MDTLLTPLVAAEHHHQLQRTAGRDALAQQARCCRTWLARWARAWLARHAG